MLFLLLFGSPATVPQLLLEVIDPIGCLPEQLRRGRVDAAIAAGVMSRAISRVPVIRVVPEHLL